MCDANVKKCVITNSWFKHMSFKGKRKTNKKQNKHIRNKFTYSNKTTAITTENINKNCKKITFYTQWLQQQLLLKQPRFQNTHQWQQAYCVYILHLLELTPTVLEKIIVFSLFLTGYVKHDLKYSQSCMMVKKTTSNKIYFITNYIWRRFIFSLNAHVSGKCRVIVHYLLLNHVLLSVTTCILFKSL